MKIRASLLSSFLIVIFLSLVTPFAQGQYRASIQGVVTDPQGAVIPGANVTLTDRETGRALTATTNDGGVYNFNALPPHHFSLTVEKGGFKKKALDDVSIISEQSNAVNVQLEVGQSSETVTVSAETAPLIDTQTAQIGGTINAQQIQTLPSFGRDVYQLVQLAPGAFGDASQAAGGGTNALPGNAGPGGSGNNTGIFATENGPQISVGGGRRELNNYQIDGVGITSVSWAGTAVITPNQDSVKEVKVVTNSYDAEDGRYPGAQVKVISQNGTNDFHGSFFFKADRPGLNAFQRYGGINKDPVRNEARFNDFGGAVGGPIIRNKLFFFFSYETIRNHGITVAQGWFETPSFLASAPGGSAAALFATFPGAAPIGAPTQTTHNCAEIGLTEGVQCTTIGGDGLDVGRPLNSSFAPGSFDPSWLSKDQPGLGGDGTGSAANLDGIADIQFLRATSPNIAIQEQYNGRLDFQATSKDLLAFSIYRVPTSSDSFNGAFRDMNLFHHTVVNEAETFLWTRAFSPTLLNEVRANAAGWRWQDLANNPNGPWGLPVINFFNLNAPTDANNIGEGLGTAGINGFGIGAPGTFDQWTYAIKDVLTKVKGSHTIKLGGEVTRLLFVDTAPWNARPTYFFHNMWDFLNDSPSQEQATFNPLTGVPTDFRKDTRENHYGFFVQDDIKLRPNLTVNLGLRWEYNGPMSEKDDNMGVVVLGQGTDILTGLRVRKGGNLYDVPKSDFGPQVGFAWSPGAFKDKIVLRGGFGMGYSGLEEAISLNGRSNPPFLSPAFNLEACPNFPSCSGANQVVYGPTSFPSDVHSFGGYGANPSAIANFDPATNLPTPGPNFTRIDLTAFPQEWPDTRTYRYSFETQMDLGHQWVATLGYQGTATRHLTRQYNLNNFSLAHGIAVNPVVQHLNLYDNEGRANFNALLADVKHSFGRAFQIETQYRWAKAMDTGSNNFANGNYQFTLDRDYGPSDYDVTHALKIFGVYSPTIFHGEHSWLEKIAGGWSISGILNAHSGFPYNPIFNIAGAALYQGSDGGGGNSGLRPAQYLGGALDDFSTDTFKNGQFPNGGPAYFVQPSLTPGPDFPTVAADPAAAGPIPGAPGIGRNAFRGPRYFDVDATLSKAFGLPRLKVIGENGKIEFRANFFNLFNKLNLFDIENDILNPNFGAARTALGSRTIELQARFSF